MNLSEAFESYQKVNTPENYEVFGSALLTYVKGATKQTFTGQATQAEIEDIGGNAIIQVLENLPNYRGEAKFHNWVSMIIEREGLQLLRKESRRKEQAYIGNEQYDPRPSLNDKITLKQIMAKLDPPERVLVQYQLEGLSDAEIAEELDVSLAATRKRWERLRIKMRTLGGG